MNKEQAKLNKVYDECIEQIGEGDEVDTATAIDCLCEIWNAWNDYTKQDEWVDVRDRLPSEDKLIVCVDKDNNYYLAYFDYDKDCFVHYDETTIKRSENIIAWKYIEPYKESE